MSDGHMQEVAGKCGEYYLVTSKTEFYVYGY